MKPVGRVWIKSAHTCSGVTAASSPSPAPWRSCGRRGRLVLLARFTAATPSTTLSRGASRFALAPAAPTHAHTWLLLCVTAQNGNVATVESLTRRHMGKANEGFADGHVELMDPDIFKGTIPDILTVDAWHRHVNVFSDR